MRGPVDVEQPRHQAHVYAPSTNINNPPPQTVPVYIVGGVVQEPLPCGGLGVGWTLFIIGIFLGAIPWYIGAFMLCCATKDEPREKPGCTACLIAAIIATVLISIWIFTSAI